MAPSLRRRAPRPPPPSSRPHQPSQASPPAPQRYVSPDPDDTDDPSDDEETADEEEMESALPADAQHGLEGDEEDQADDDEDEEDDELLEVPVTLPSAAVPPNLREISGLASWTVSSSKPGCSIPQLRSPNTNLFWQSDGPQPHYLNIHFFKLVRIVSLRLFLDFEADESYTPTRIVFLAGSGGNDLQEWGEMKLEQPNGWVWVNFEGVGEISDDDDEEEEYGAQPSGAGTSTSGHSHSPATGTATQSPNRKSQIPSPAKASPSLTPVKHMPVLRAHLVQIKILENHQNGKDTHLRGLQIFSRDDDSESRATSSGSRQSVSPKKVHEGRSGGGGLIGSAKGRTLRRSEWDTEPAIR